jgi:colanic acid/amylovoran biosynthesis glycosyltransferase
VKITVLLDTFPALSETFLYRTIHNWQNAGLDVRLLARKRGSVQYQTSMPAEVIYLPSETLPTLLKLGAVLLYLAKLCFHPEKIKRAWRCLAHGQGLRRRLQLAARCLPLYYYESDLMYFPFGGLAVRYLEYILETEARVVMSLRGTDIHYDPVVDLEYRKRLEQALLPAAGIHSVCNEILECARELTGSDLSQGKTIYSALPESLLQAAVEPRPENTVLEILSVGRLEWLKGLEHGIVAAHALRQRGVHFRWRIIGDGEYRLPLQWAIRDMGLQEHVFLCGPMNHRDALQIMGTVDVLFHPSIHEGISNAVLEAMALGLAVVATDVGGMREAIPSEATGLLVPVRDWKSMADALERLARNPELRRQMGCAARALVCSRFTSERQTADFLEFFKRILNGERV